MLVTDDEEIRELNRRFRGVDAPTDVLAFPQQPPSGAPGQPAAQPLQAWDGSGACGPHLLGDVVISALRARHQARERHISFDQEMGLLVIHGVLHLAGWCDDSDAEKRRMLRRGRAIWRLVKA